MLLLISIILWVFIIVLLIRTIQNIALSGSEHKIYLLVWAGLLLCAIFVLFRPHETVLSGEDPGAYVQATATFARDGHIIYKDEMLNMLPVSERSNFFLYSFTKDSTFYIRNLENSTLGPRFQPFYSILAIPAAKISPSAILYVVPLFTLLTALALAGFAVYLFGYSWTGIVVFAFYIFCPLVVWHGRSPRPEIVASFFLIAGSKLLFSSLYDKNRWQVFDLLLGAIAISLAPFLHITSWTVVICIAVIVLGYILSGCRIALLYVPVAFVGLLLFILQTIFIVDPYSLTRFVQPLWDHIWWLILLFSVGFGLLIWISFSGKLRNLFMRITVAVTQKFKLYSIIFSVLIFLFVIWLYLRSVPIPKRVLTVYQYHYLYPTDMRVVRKLLSTSIMILVFAGLQLMVLKRKNAGRKIIFLACFLPAACLVGNIYNFFMSRYLMVTAIPILVMALTAVVVFVYDLANSKYRVLCTVTCTLVVCSLLVRNRSQLITVREHKGMLSFMSEIADGIKGKEPILFGEYTRLVAPFEHFYGIPVLALDNEKKFDYRSSMKSWQKIMSDNSDRDFYYLTPYPNPYSELFDYKFITNGVCNYETLENARWKLPEKVKSGYKELYLYSMTLSSNNVVPLIWKRQLDASNIGLSDFSRVKGKNWSVQGFPLWKDIPYQFTVGGNIAAQTKTTLSFFCLNKNYSYVPAPDIYINNSKLKNVAWNKLHANWWILTAENISIKKDDEIELSSTNDILVVDSYVNGIDISPVISSTNSYETIKSPFYGRWARGNSSFLIPVVAKGKKTTIYMLMKVPEQSGEAVTVTLNITGKSIGIRKVNTSEWQWYAWTFTGGKPRFDWVNMNITPTWDPQNVAYPSDLGARVSYIYVTAK